MPSLRPSPAVTVWLGYLAFVVYGSLLPFDLKPLPLDQAWYAFLQTPLLKLGVASRADWIANGVLYVPAGFLTAHVLRQKYHFASLSAVLLLAGLLSGSLALAVEFSQLFFPPRTVSLNDLLAEFLGSALGLLLAANYSDWFRNLLHARFGNSRKFILYAVEAYLVGYVAFSLFPYDILLSSAELAQKIQSGSWNLLLAGDGHDSLRTILKLLSESILTLPFGLYLGYRSMRRPVTFGRAALLGILLGSFIELAQFFTATGISQGLSLLTRAAGTCGGLALWQRRADLSPGNVAAFIRRHVPLFGTVYFLVLLVANDWFSHRWHGVDYAISRLDGLHFLPFYYHYFTTEAKALFSLASVCLMYVPVGLLTWANRGSQARAFWFSLFTVAIVESGKLFLQGSRPDPTNLLLGALAGWGIVPMAKILAEAAGADSVAPDCTVQDDMSSFNARTETRPVTRMTGLGYMAMLPVLALSAWNAATFPVGPAWLCLLLAASAALVWFRPVLLLLVIPLALPVLDFAPWSGRFYLDEFDLLVLVCLAVGYARTSPTTRHQPRDHLFSLSLALIASSFAVAAMRGLLPWQTPNANAFTSYFTPFNALRIGKGALWAFLLTGLLGRFPTAREDIHRYFSIGMAGGLTLSVSVIFWERITFGSLLDFNSDYRVTGPISAMHVGGGFIECLLAVATPFLMLLVVQTQSGLKRLLGAGVLLATTYALMVTFSRNGYAAFAAALLVFLFFVLGRGNGWKRGVLATTLLGVMLAVALPVFTGQYAQKRIANISRDFAMREAHWQDALRIRSPDWATTLFGMGLGRYPQSHYLFSGEPNRSGTYQLRTEEGNTFLRLHSGEALYVEQIVPIEPNRRYTLKLRIRSAMPEGKINLSVCEKWMLTSFSCVWKDLTENTRDATWRSVEVHLDSGRLGDSPWYAWKPVKISLHNPTGKSGHYDIENIRIETPDGKNLLRNGNFTDELDHWFFTVDNYWPWHVENIAVTTLFEQGWFGLAALGFFSLVAIKRSASRALEGNLHAAACLASLTAYLVAGFLTSPVDAPRFLFLFLLLGGFCGRDHFHHSKGHDYG